MALPEPIAATGVADDVEIVVAGVRLVADVSGALWWPEAGVLIVADLHLEKGSAFARRGTFLPPYDSRSTLARLEDVVARRQPSRVISLGDSFHDVGGPDRLAAPDRHALLRLQRGRRWTWVTGNHDPSIGEQLGGEVCAHVALDRLTLCHEPSDGPADGEIAGHLHPCARIASHGRSIRARCFVSDGRRMVIPAFGAYTGGLNVCDPAFDALFPPPGPQPDVWMVGRDGVYPIDPRRLRGD